MQIMSDNYKTLLSDPAARFSLRVEDESTGASYGADIIKSAEISWGLFSGEPSVGHCCAAELTLTLRDPTLYDAYGTRPGRMATLRPFLRLYGAEAYQRIILDGEPFTGDDNDALYAELWGKVQISEEFPMGVFHVDTRERDAYTGDMTLHCFDGMLMLEQNFTWEGRQTGWFIKDIDAVTRVCQICNMGLSSLTAPIDRGYYLRYPEDKEDGPYACREILEQVAAMYGGNWIMAEDWRVENNGYLRLVQFGQESAGTVLGTETGKVVLFNGKALQVSKAPSARGREEEVLYAGFSAEDIQLREPFPAYTRVTVDIGEYTSGESKNTYPVTAAADTDGSLYLMDGKLESALFAEKGTMDETVVIPPTLGIDIRVSCPLLSYDWEEKTTAEQRLVFRLKTAADVAHSILAQLSGYVYQPFSATNVITDPAAQPGDAISIGGVRSVIAYMRTSLGVLCTADIEAPGEAEIDHEYDFKSAEERELERKLRSAAKTGGAQQSRTTRLDVYGNYFIETLENGEQYQFSYKTEGGKTTIGYPDGRTLVIGFN